MKKMNLLAVSLLIVFLTACASRSGQDPQPESVPAEEDFLFYPRMEKPAVRPLGRVLLRWSPVEFATGYTLHMSYSRDFSSIEKSWTISGLSLELPIEPGVSLWFRIRAFNDSRISRWSAALEVSE